MAHSRKLSCIALMLLLLILCAATLHPNLWTGGTTNPMTALAHPSPPSPFLGDYAGELREPRPRKDGVRHVDTPRLIQKLKELGVTHYFYLIWHAPTDWDDLRHEFLPAARQAGIDVWVYLVPLQSPAGSNRNPLEPIMSLGSGPSAACPGITQISKASSWMTSITTFPFSLRNTWPR